MSGRALIECAAMHQHNHIVRYLRANGFPWDDDTSYWLASRSASFETLKWAIADGCPWHPDTTESIVYAEDYYDFEVLKWAIENGCPWDPSLAADLSLKYKPEEMNWVIQNGRPKVP